MRLKIENLGKINRADIEINGITVIAGDNNTGKSTVGKALFAIFNALYNSDEKIKDLRREELEKNIQNMYENYLGWDKNLPIRINFSLQLARNLLNNKKCAIDKIVKDAINSYHAEIAEEDLKQFQVEIKNAVDRIMSISAEILRKEFVQRYFLEVFNEQVNSLVDLNADMNILLTIKNKDIKITFADNKCMDLNAPYKILHEAFYIDDPFIINSLMSSFFMLDGKGVVSAEQEHLIKSIRKYNRLEYDNIFDSLFAEKSLEEIYAILNDVVEGKILFQNDGIRMENKKFSKPINVNNLSTGLKTFVILKILLERGILKEKDVLILDEPEIHLHPKWQMQYAQIIVLLQKFFDLSIIVTTHSADFLAAIEYYAKKHGNIDKCKFYLAENRNDFNTFADVTDRTEEIYKQMFAPKFRLDELNYELDENEDE